MISLDDNISNDLLDNKLELYSLNEALKIAEEKNLSSEIIDLLKNKRDVVLSEYTEVTNRVLRQLMKDRSNIAMLHDTDWCVVKYNPSKNNYGILIEPFISKNLLLLSKNDTKKKLTKNDIEMLMSSRFINGSIKQTFIRKSIARSIEILNEISPDMQLPEEISVSIHACKRWIQRVLKITETSAIEKYRRANHKEVEQDILKAFKNAELLWSHTDGTEFWIDLNNTIYVFNNSTIITLYIEDFGFSKEINKSIVMMQIKEVQKAYDNLSRGEINIREEDSMVTAKMCDIDSRVKTLKAELDFLTKKKDTLISKQTELLCNLTLLKEQYMEQYNKLFKKHE